MPILSLSHGNLFYSISGAGKPLFFLHGLGGDHSQLPGLIGSIEGFQQICMDFPSHGQSDPLSRHRFGAFADLVEALRRHLKIEEPVWLTGMSMGAGTGLRYAVTYPEQIAGLVLIRPAWLTAPFPENLSVFMKVADLIAEFGPEGGLKRWPSTSEYSELATLSPACAAAIAAQFTRPQAAEASTIIRDIVGDCPVTDWSAVRQIKVPTLVIKNDGDPIHPEHFGDVLADQIPGAVCVAVASRYEAPEQHQLDLSREVKGFLESQI